jgi:hypothetical protein
MFSRAGYDIVSALKAKPVDHAANAPHTAPKPGINIGSPIIELCTKIPIASIPSIDNWNSSRNAIASSSETIISAPIEYAPLNIPTKIRNISALFFLVMFLF